MFSVIKVQIGIALDQQKLVRRIRGSEREKNILDKYIGQINYWSQELNKINSKRETLFENFVEGLFRGAAVEPEDGTGTD